MITDIGQIAATVVASLAPFLPFLVDVGKTGGQKFAEVIAEKGGDAAWNKAQALWAKVHVRFQDDAEVNSAATMLAVKPEDERRQTVLAEVLGERLKADPELTTEVFELFGGQQAVQQVLSERESWVEDVSQYLAGTTGSQSVIARDNSIVKGVRQDIQHS